MTDKPKNQDAQEVIKDGKAHPDKITGMGTDEQRAARLHKLQAALDPNSPEYDAKVADTFRDIWEVLLEMYRKMAPTWQEFAQLEPFLEQVITAPEFKGLTIDELIAAGEDPDGKPIPGTLWAKAWNDAKVAWITDKVTTQAKRTENLDFPLDKVNSEVWGLLENDTHGQIGFNMAKRDSDEPLLTYYSINFDELANLENIKITKHLTAFDKIIYIAAAALYNAGNEWITATQIYYLMGNDRSKTPNAAQLDKILAGVRKMRNAGIYIDNSEEAKKYDYPVFRYEASLFPLEIVTATINGKTTGAAIHLLREPPLMTFARERRQVTTIDTRLLAAPISKTESHLAIQDYLLERIARAKRDGKKQERILYAKIAEKTNNTGAKRSRVQEAVKIYLQHFKAETWITDFTTDKDGITAML